jgi:hypothetical protein
VIPVAQLQVEVGIEEHLVHGDGSDCPVGIPLRDGVYTDQGPKTSRQVPVTIGLAAYKLLGSRREWVVGLGGGWTAARGHAPYVRALIGIRRGHRVRWGVDAVMDTYGVPWKSRTAEYQQGIVVKVISERSYRDWASSVGLVLRVGFPFVGK